MNMYVISKAGGNPFKSEDMVFESDLSLEQIVEDIAECRRESRLYIVNHLTGQGCREAIDPALIKAVMAPSADQAAVLMAAL